MKILGLVIAKENSNRFPNKNIHIVNGKPMFFHSVELLSSIDIIDDVYVATNSDYIGYCCDVNNIKTIWRGVNVSEDEEPLFSVLKYCYKAINCKYDIVVNLLANSLNHTKNDIEKSIEVLTKHNLKEVRSYNIDGVENGLLSLDASVFDNYEISSYVGMIQSKAKEIHTVDDL